MYLLRNFPGFTRLAGPAAMLMLLLQRTPLLRVLCSAEFGSGARLGQMLRAAFPAFAGALAVNTLTGATRFTTNPASPASATVGTAFSAVFSVTGAPSTPKSYTVTGLPAGLTVPSGTVSAGKWTLNSSTGSISGTPTTAGSFTVSIIAYANLNGGAGDKSPVYNYVINVTGSANAPPAFTTQPSSQTVTAGANVTFTVAASGTPTPTLQWRKGGANLAGQTSATLSLASVTTTDAGNYDCVATNTAGTATSTAATLTVNAANVTPSFTTQPTSQTVTAGANVNFTVAASGTPTPTLQWRKGGANLTGQTSATLSLTGVTTASAGTYDCVATNTAGTATSTAATLTVNAANVAPNFTTQPVSQTVAAGGSVSFTVAASGTPTPTLQWRKGTTNLTGQTNATLSLTGVTTANAGSYDCVATNAAGTATSTAATLTVNAANVAPSFSTQPSSQTASVGGSVSFTVAVSGTPTPTLQWRKGSTNLAGQTSATLSLANVVTGDAGSYSCVATNVAGSVASSAATLTVAASAAPAISVQPAPMTSLAGRGAFFAIQASGSGLTYQWFKGGVAIAGATQSSLLLSNVQSTSAGTYSVVVSSSSGGQVASNAAGLSVVSSGSARLINMSARAGVGAGADVLIPGFVIEGDVALTLLIRGVGPQLAALGVPGTLADPVMSVFSGQAVFVTNDDWEQSPDLAALNAATTACSAFPLAAGGKDCALLVTLNPGVYTVQVTGKGGLTGVALVELYVVGP